MVENDDFVAGEDVLSPTTTKRIISRTYLKG